MQKKSSEAGEGDIIHVCGEPIDKAKIIGAKKKKYPRFEDVDIEG